MQLRECVVVFGGGGWVSTLRDYVRFAEAIRNNGALHAVRILSPKTVEYMSTDHLPGSISRSAQANPTPGGPGRPFVGFGYGLGFGIATDTVLSRVMGSNGELYWGGRARTNFSIDPVEEIVVVSMMHAYAWLAFLWS